MARKMSNGWPNRECEYLFNERAKIEYVAQPLIDRGLLNARTVANDLKKEKDNPVLPLVEDQSYNFYVRRMALTWLTHVVGHCRISVETYGLSIRIFDKAMETLRYSFEQNTFQLIAAACLIMASKLLDTITLPVQRVIEFADNTFTENRLYNFEVLVLDSLKTPSGRPDICGVSPVDMIAPIAYVVADREIFERVRSNAYLFYSLLAPSRVLHGIYPSLVAGSLIYRGHVGFCGCLRLMRVRDEIIRVIETTRDCFDNLVEEIENAYIEWIADAEIRGSLVYLPSFKLISAEGTPTDIVSTSSVIDMLK